MSSLNWKILDMANRLFIRFFFLFFSVIIICIFGKTGFAAIPQSPTGNDSTYQRTDTLTYELDEIVVTGTRYDKKIIDIPYSVMRIDNDQCELAGGDICS